MMKSILVDTTARYHPIESWVYDRCIAPAVTDVLVERVRGALDRVAGLDGEVHGDLLDVGCGGGQNALTLERLYPDLRITGVDLSPEQVGRARARAAARGSAVRFHEGNALDLPFETASFDVVISIGSIKHWPSPRRGLRECLRVLRPGGRLIIAEIDRACRPEAARDFVHRFRIPGWLEGLATLSFRKLVSDRSLDSTALGGMLTGVPLDDVEVTLLEGLPAWQLTGTKSGR